MPMIPNKGGPRLLATDREGALYLERSRIHVEGERVVYHIADDENRREFNIPHVNLAVLFIGQGTSITQDAMRLLGEEGVHLAVTGTGGSPLHMGSLTTYTSTRHFREILPIYLCPSRSLLAAKEAMRIRTENLRTNGVKEAQKRLFQRDMSSFASMCIEFDEKLKSQCDGIPQLLGMEGQFTKRCYAEFARMAGIKEFRRSAGVGDKGQANEYVYRVNRLIDHGNYLCYGMAGAALWALGIPPHLSIFHGKTRAGGLVFDLADTFKDALVLPLAFASALNHRDSKPNQTFRNILINSFDDHRTLAKAIGAVERMIESTNRNTGTSSA